MNIRFWIEAIEMVIEKHEHSLLNCTMAMRKTSKTEFIVKIDPSYLERNTETLFLPRKFDQTVL